MNEFTATAWGGFQTLAREDGVFEVKRLYIYPGCCMSNQRHQGRVEKWNVVKGILGLSIAGTDYELHAEQGATVPVGVWHAAYNATREVVEVIEVWIGKDLREDDIERKPYTGILKDMNWSYGENKN
jgi:mannose-6-phosphate isomerase-like protein (cupin superfamily)